MRIVNTHEAKTHLSALIEKAVQGEPFIIARAGKPLVQVQAISHTPATEPCRLGFLSKEMDIPDDFDQMGEQVILQLFGENR